MGDSNPARVQRLWQEIQQILKDHATNQETNENNYHHSADDITMNNLFKQGNADSPEENEDAAAKKEVVADVEDEYVVSQVLKSKIFDDIGSPPSPDDFVVTTKKEKSGSSLRFTGEYSSHASRSTSNFEARSTRRPPGERGWR